MQFCFLYLVNACFPILHSISVNSGVKLIYTFNIMGQAKHVICSHVELSLHKLSSSIDNIYSLFSQLN